MNHQQIPELLKGLSKSDREAFIRWLDEGDRTEYALLTRAVEMLKAIDSDPEARDAAVAVLSNEMGRLWYQISRLR